MDIEEKDLKYPRHSTDSNNPVHTLALKQNAHPGHHSFPSAHDRDSSLLPSDPAFPPKHPPPARRYLVIGAGQQIIRDKAKRRTKVERKRRSREEDAFGDKKTPPLDVTSGMG